jgi:hypothetical protein
VNRAIPAALGKCEQRRSPPKLVDGYQDVVRRASDSGSIPGCGKIADDPLKDSPNDTFFQTRVDRGLGLHDAYAVAP